MIKKKFTCSSKRIGWDTRIMAIKMLERRQDILEILSVPANFAELFLAVYQAYADKGSEYSKYYATQAEKATQRFSLWIATLSIVDGHIQSSKLIAAFIRASGFCPVKNIILPVVGMLTLIDMDELPKYLNAGGYKSSKITHAVTKWRMTHGI